MVARSIDPIQGMTRYDAGSDKMPRDMCVIAENIVRLPVLPFLVLGLIFVASLAVFLWITRPPQSRR